MALMVNYCETHRIAFPVVEHDCPQRESEGECRVVNRDAVALIERLGCELREAEETEYWGMHPELKGGGEG